LGYEKDSGIKEEDKSDDNAIFSPRKPKLFAF
jgi:hypothetical protein